MIPKIIHYCWFGNNPIPPRLSKCISSWKKVCPGYTFMLWNETNFDIKKVKYVRQAYESKKWAFVTDFVRLYVLVKYGGIYLDTDVELIKNIDELLKHDAVLGFENRKTISTCFMACKKSYPIFKRLLMEYYRLSFVNKNGSLDTTTNVTRVTRMYELEGLKLNNTRQIVADTMIYPNDYFSPINYSNGEKKITANTKAIHWFSESWKSEEEKAWRKRKLYLFRRYGVLGQLLIPLYDFNCRILKSIKIIRYEGVKSFGDSFIRFIYRKFNR